MTKAELIAALAALPDTAWVLVCPVGLGQSEDAAKCSDGDLHPGRVEVYESDGPDGPPFAVVAVEYSWQ